MDKPSGSKAGVELDKFKRRLIRAVARLLLHEKKAEEEIWKELRKETGCDCELLWTRMRALTLKKLDRLLAANDCMDAVPKAARMSLTDWLLFDLVLVHQKIDLIGQNNSKHKEDRPVLVELFELVKKFNLEGLSGETLADAWSMATLYYNKKGHHCSPMLLQRRWYQLKELTRLQFYDFWYAYRGNLTRVSFAEPYRPSPLQTEIAKTFKLLVTQPFLEWEELVKQRLVTLPEEFERKMKERSALKGPVPEPTEDVPDLVMIEPRIETIDLRLEPDDNATEDNKQEEEEVEVVLPPLVRIKQEPQDDMEVNETQIQPPKKSIYEVVLESTSLENERLDSMDAGDFVLENDDIDNEEIEEIEETEEAVRNEEESVLPQIGSVFGNVSDTSILANIDEDRVYGNAENTEVRGNVDNTNVINVDDTNVCNDKNNRVSDTIVRADVEDSARGNEKESGACDSIDEISARNNDVVIEVSSDDKEADICDNAETVSENVGETSPDGDVADEINEISDDDDISGNVDATNDIGNVDETSVIGNVEETSISHNVEETSRTGNVEETNVFGNVICNVVETVTDTVEVIGDSDKTNVNCEAEVVSTAAETSVSGNVEVTGNVYDTSVNANVEDTSELVASENVAALNPRTAYPATFAALIDKKKSAVTNTAEVSKDIEIIDTTPDPVVITDSDEDDDNIADDLIINKTVPKSTEEDIIVPKDTKDQPMDVDSTPEVLKISLTEPLTVKNIIEDAANAEHSVENKVEVDIKPDAKSFKFGELPNAISFADEGIEFVDDGIVYVDEDSHTETKMKCEEEYEDEDTPKIDAKLLMCPIVYTTRLDDMNMFHTPIDHNIYINDKQLLDKISKKSKPIKKEAENDSKETIENVTVNYCGENIESVTVNDSLKTIEYVQKNVDENVLVNDSIIIKKEPENVKNEAIEYVQKNIDENVLVKDSSILITKEPENIKSETIDDVPKDNIVSIEDVIQQNTVPVEYTPENDNDVTSDDDDYEENVIDESQKVKPTSYLLQKPRSRKYHPIQLCKNPDFNTRLKRLSVRFFGSPRNRVLIKSCKPLTIDLSKAFESKLVSGTLYLKPVDHNVVTEVIDDIESHNVSVVPSAMPAQSLIDNSKVADILPMLRRCLEASKQPEDVGPTSERNKIINLPDISEIRRINQRLLTAEVTPIQVQNNRLQVPVTIVTSSNTPTYPAQKTRTIAGTDTDLRSTVSEATDARGPPKLLDITDDSPAKKTPEYYSGKYGDGYRIRPVLPGRPPRMMNGKRLILPKPAPWKPRQFRPEVPWRPKDYEANINFKKETLLTLDTLNKMLFLLTDKLEPEAVIAKKPKPKVKRKNSDQQTKQRGRPKLNPDDSRYMVLLRKSDEADEELNSSSEASSKCQKPKINIKSATNYPPDKDKTVVAETEQPKKKTKYCCWARQRMLQMLFSRKSIPQHGCRKVCACCCSNLLRDFVLQDQKIKNTELESIKATPYLGEVSVVSERTISSESSKGGVENSVQTPMEIPAQVPDVEAVHDPDVEIVHDPDVEIVHDPDVEIVQDSGAGTVSIPENIPVIDVDATNTESTTNNTITTTTNTTTPNTTTENEPIDIEAMDTEGDIPVPACEVSVTTTEEVEKLTGRGLEVPVNVTAKRRLGAVSILKNHNFISCVTPEVGKPEHQYTHCISSDNQSGGVILNAIKTPSTAITQTITQPPSLKKMLAAKKSKAPNRFKINMPQPPILSKPFVPPAHFKEKLIFLSSKHISEKPSKSPVFLGKNKILLTTIKFPPNLKFFEEAKKALRHSLNLPNGVRLILLSNGSMACKIDQNVPVDATELTEMPAIIAAIQARMDTIAAQEEALKKQTGVNESEVVDLIDDDDESAPNVNDNENNETPLVTETKQTKQSTEETVTINSNDSPDVSHNPQINTLMCYETEENRTDLNINSNAIGTESNQNESVDQYTVSEIQENVRQNETLSASTEQVQDQPDSTSQTVSAEKDDQPKPSSQTDVHEVSSEQAQNQSDPTSQTVSAEKDDQSKPSSQTGSTDVLEVSSERAQNQSDPTSQTVSAEKDDQPKSSSQTGSTDVLEVTSEQAQNQSDLTSQTVSAEKDDQPKPSSQTGNSDVHKVSSEQAQNQSDPTSQTVSAEKDDQPKSSSQTGSTDVLEVTSEQAQNQSDLTSQTVSAEKDDQSKPSSHTDVHEVSAKQAQDQSEPGQNVSVEVQDHLETATQNVNSETPEESASSRPKTKNILSDLMEMSGIFDEDMTSEIEEIQPTETHAAQPAEQVVLTQASLVASEVEESPAQEAVQPPALASASAGTNVVQPILIPANYNSANPLAPKLQSPLGELSPITSLYELKYACANKGVFFKLDFDSGFLVPINVCMKPTVQKPMQPPTGSTPQNIAPKSVIDLTEDDDKPEQTNTESDTSPSKRSLLLVNHLPGDSCNGSVKPVKMFKALKPSILQRLNQNKMHLEGKNPLLHKSADHSIKRKQFLRKINMNADSEAVSAYVQPGDPVPVRRYVRRIKVKRNSNNSKVTDEADEATPTTSRKVPYKEYATTILSDDDSSDDEPLAKIAKRKHENANAPEQNKTSPEQNKTSPESVTKCIELELPAADVQPEAPVEKQTESELPAADAETFNMSDDDNDSINLEAPFGFESNEEDEGDCILGV